MGWGARVIVLHGLPGCKTRESSGASSWLSRILRFIKPGHHQPYNVKGFSEWWISFFFCVCVKDQARFRKGFARPVTLCLFPFTIKLKKGPYIHQWKCLQSPGWVTVSWTEWGSNGLSGAPQGLPEQPAHSLPLGHMGSHLLPEPGAPGAPPAAWGAQGCASASPRGEELEPEIQLPLNVFFPWGNISSFCSPPHNQKEQSYICTNNWLNS